VFAVDTNVLLYAVNTRSEYRDVCRRRLEEWRRGPTPTFLTWSVVYEFLRASTHPRTFPSPLRASEARGFIGDLLASPGFEVLGATARHFAVLTETLEELPRVQGNLVHDLHIAVVLREHGISQICTRDRDFHRFPFLTVIDPVE
jgi:hypothetical protein